MAEGGLDRDAARGSIASAIRRMVPYTTLSEEQWSDLLDELEGCVRPAPQQAVDHGTLVSAQLATHTFVDTDGYRSTAIHSNEEAADRVLALLRPVDGDSEYEIGYITGQRDAAGGYWRRDVKHGVTLTRDEAALVRVWYSRLPFATTDDAAVAARLEEAS